jgi:predicted GTPase
MEVPANFNEEILLTLVQNFYNSQSNEARDSIRQKILFHKTYPQYYPFIFKMLSTPESNESYNLFFINTLKEDIKNLYLPVTPSIGTPSL